MAIIRRFSGDGLSNGPLTTSTAGTGDTAFDVVSSGWSVDDLEGLRTPAVMLTKESGVAPAIHWTNLGSLPSSSARVYVKLTGAPSATTTYLSTMDASNTRVFDLALLTTTRLRLHDADNAQVGSLPIMDTNTWYRIEWTHSPTQVAVHQYLGDSTVPLGTVTWNGTVPEINRFRAGLNSTGNTSPPLWMDDFAVSNEAQLIGPAGTPTGPPSPIKTWSGTEYIDLNAYVWSGSEYTPAVIPVVE